VSFLFYFPCCKGYFQAVTLFSEYTKNFELLISFFEDWTLICYSRDRKNNRRKPRSRKAQTPFGAAFSLKLKAGTMRFFPG
jgi:hypothetical protein